MIATVSAVIAFVVISYSCFLVHTTFKDLEDVLSVKEEHSNNER